MKKFFKILFSGIGILLVVFVSYFLVITKLDNNAMEMKGFYSGAYDAAKATLLPSMFVNGERFYIKIPTTEGDTALAFGDSGGGVCMMLPSMANRPGFQPRVKTGLFKGVMPMRYILSRDVLRGESIPPPVLMRSRILRHPLSRVAASFFLVPPMDDELKFLVQCMPLDIFLGQNFFMGRSWTIDYIRREVWVNTPLLASEAGKPGVQKLGFKKNANQENVYGHPSMFIEVDGEIIEVLFDTGATIVLSEAGKKEFNTTEKTIGGSFIAASIFDKWRKSHPDWKCFEKAETKNDVIEVPKVKIGGYEVGPVLFARRPDDVWSEGMIATMDRVVKGAIGGSALKYFKVMADYNSELIKFERD